MTSNLMQPMFDYFLTLHHQNSGTPTGNTILSFQPIGTQITPKMFKLKTNDTSYSTALSVEVFSGLTNVVPEIKTGIFQRRMERIHELYEFMLASSESPQDDKQDLAIFDKFHGQAKTNFEQIMVGSSFLGKPQFHPAYATPSDWYDTTSEDNWDTYNSETSNSSTTAESSGPAEWQWQVLPIEFVRVLDHPEVVDRLSTIDTSDLKEVLLHPDTSNVDTSGVMLHSDLESRLDEVLKVDIGSQIGQNLSAELPASGLMMMSQMSTANFMARSIQADSVSAVDMAQTDMSQTMISARQPINEALLEAMSQTAVDFQPTQLTEAIQPISSPITQIARFEELRRKFTTQTSVVSTQLTVSFKYCLVEIERPWISQTYLQTKGWYLPKHVSGEFSTGTLSNNSGKFPVIPISFILIKDVQISNWSDSETESVARSAGFGPFSFIGRTIDKQKKVLTMPGAQIIGWVCQAMPLLPPDSDPTP